MLKLIKCEFLKLKRKPLVFISLLLSVFMPLAYAFFLADVNTDVDAVNGVMSSLFQLSAYLLLMPLLVILASNLLFEEFDNDTLKNLVTVPVNRTKLVLSKMLVLLLFAVGFMAVGGLVNLAVLLFQGWEPVGFWNLFGVGIEEGLIMWVGALPCILLVVLLNKNYIVSVVITFFYTIANYILSMNDMFLTQSISTLALLEAPEFGNTDCIVTITAYRDGKQIGTLNTELTLHTAYLWPKEVQ